MAASKLELWLPSWTTPLPVWSKIIPTTPIRQLGAENIGLAVEIPFLSFVQAEIPVCHF